MKIDITVTRMPNSGLLVLSTIVEDRYIHVRYMGYSVSVAKAKFRKHVIELVESSFSSNLSKEYSPNE